MRARTRTIERRVGWLVAAYAMLRIVAVDSLFAEHGVQTSLFAVVELATAYPYGVAMVRLASALAGRAYRAALLPGLVAVCCFAAPYALVVVQTGRSGEAPLAGLAVFGLVTLVAAAVGLRGRVRDHAGVAR